MNTLGFSDGAIAGKLPAVSRPVLLVGGFGLPPATLARLARTLDARIAPTGLTVGCGEREAQTVVSALDGLDEPITLVGHSRGGQLALVAAARRPDAVRQVITVGTPASIGPPQRWGVPLLTAALRRLPINLALDCATGPCCASFRRDLAKPVTVSWTSLWSPIDRIVDDPLRNDADSVEVRASHIGLVTSRTGRDAIVKAMKG